MDSKNLRTIKVTVTAQTAWNLNKLAAMSGSKTVGHVIDKLVRAKMLELNEYKNEGKGETHGQREHSRH